MSKNQTIYKKGKKMLKKTALIALVFAMAVCSTPFAQREPGERKGKDFKQLNLTPDQKKQIESKRIELKERMIDLRAQLEKKELERNKLFLNENISRSELINLTKDISEIKNEMEIARVNHSLDVFELLDANQKVIWKEMQIKRDRFKDGMKREIIGKMDCDRHKRMRN